MAKVPAPQVRPGIKIPVRGVPHRIVHEPSKRGTVTISSDERGPLLIVHGDRVHLPRRIADFLKREAKREIEKLVVKHTQALGKRAKAIRFKDTSSRWGSCTSEGNLSFSWRIMMAPTPVINYLVAHEVAHLKEMNHGPKFWKLCEQLCPDTERCKTWLKRNGGALQAIVLNRAPRAAVIRKPFSDPSHPLWPAGQRGVPPASNPKRARQSSFAAFSFSGLSPSSPWMRPGQEVCSNSSLPK